MKQVLLFILLLLFSSCALFRPEPIKKIKRVKFEPLAESNLIVPSFQRDLDSNRNLRILVRSSEEPDSEIETEDLAGNDRLVMFMENSLVRHHFKVMDRALYTDYKRRNPFKAYPFDYIVEITKTRQTTHYTGIYFQPHNWPHILKGKILSLKIISAKTGEIVALLNAEYVPCLKGCKIVYDQYEIHKVTVLGQNDKESDFKGELAHSDEGLQELCDYISRILLMKAQKSTHREYLEQ